MKFHIWHYQSLAPDKAHRRRLRIMHPEHGIFVVVECVSVAAFVQGHGGKVPWQHYNLN